MMLMANTIGLVPLAMGAGQTGKEILHPLAIVVMGADQLDTDGSDRDAGPVLQIRPQSLRASLRGSPRRNARGG